MTDQELLERIAALEERVNRLESPQPAVSPSAAEPPPPTPPTVAEPPPAPSPPVAAPPSPSVVAPPRPRPTRNWEALIGGSILNRIGIAAVLIGSAYFLRHAFEHEWIGPGMRVVIGIVIGVVLLGWAERLRGKGARIFAHSVDVISVGVLYLSIWSASQLYGLIPNGVAFVAMVAITATTVALALRHDSEFLAALAMTAGFLTPVLLGNVEGRTAELFAYLLLLNVASLVLLTMRPWVRLFIVNFAGTLFLYIGWYATTYSPDRLAIALGFTTACFIVFAIIPLVRRWSSIPQLQLAILVLLPLANAFVFFAQLSLLLSDQRALLVTFTGGLGAFFLAMAGLLIRRSPIQSDPLRPLADLHLGIGLGFMLLTIPLHFEGSAVTIAWLVAAAILFAVHARLRHPVLSIAAVIALAVAVLRLVLFDDFETGMVLINLRAFSYALAVGLCSWLAHMARSRPAPDVRNLAMFGANALAIIGLTREVGDLFSGQTLARDFAWSSLWMLYAVGMMVAGFRRSVPFIRWLALGLLGFTILKVFFYDLSELEAIYRIMSFIALGVILLGVSFVYQRLWLEPGR